MADRKSPNPRAPSPGHEAQPPDRKRVLADAIARVRDQKGRLAGENPRRATPTDVAHWIAVYTELLAFKDELLDITGRRGPLLSKDARGEAADDHLVLGAQADKYARRLHEWQSLERAAVDAAASSALGATLASITPVRRVEAEDSRIAALRALSAGVARLGRIVAGALAILEVEAIAARFARDETTRGREENSPPAAG